MIYTRKEGKKDEFVRIDLNRRDSRCRRHQWWRTITRNPENESSCISFVRADRTNRWIKWTARRGREEVAQSRRALNPSNKKTLDRHKPFKVFRRWRAKPRNWDVSCYTRLKLIHFNWSVLPHRGHYSRKIKNLDVESGERLGTESTFSFFFLCNCRNKSKGLSIWRNSIFL